MKLKLLTITCLFLFLSGDSLAYEYFTPYQKSDYIMEAIFVGLVLIDWKQTKEFRKDGKKETNPYLGEEPTQEEIDTKIGLGIISHALFMYFLPREFRPIWGTMSITLEVVAINDNCNAGYCPSLNIGFNF